MNKKKSGYLRLDDALVRQGLVDSKERGAALILSGQVTVDGERIDKAGYRVSSEAIVKIRQGLDFVGRGALKLDEALKSFSIDVTGKLCADVGASTGGFTEVLLRRGAAKVFAIDVGYGELDWKLRSDPRVVTLERTNARYLQALPEEVQFVSVDVSFISLKMLIPVIKGWLSSYADIVALIKPQFEARREEVEEGGIITSLMTRHRVLNEVLDSANEHGFYVRDLILSPIKGRKGNQEYLGWFDNYTLKSERTDDLLAKLDETD